MRLVQESLRASRELSRLAWRHPFSRGSSWFSTVVVTEVFAAFAVVASGIGVVVTEDRLDYFLVGVGSAVLLVAAAAGATAVVRHGLHLEPPNGESE